MRIETGEVWRVRGSDRTVLVEREIQISNRPRRRHFHISDLNGNVTAIDERGLVAATMREQRDFWRECYFELLNDL